MCATQQSGQGQANEGPHDTRLVPSFLVKRQAFFYQPSRPLMVTPDSYRFAQLVLEVSSIGAADSCFRTQPSAAISARSRSP